MPVARGLWGSARRATLWALYPRASLTCVSFGFSRRLPRFVDDGGVSFFLFSFVGIRSSAAAQQSRTNQAKIPKENAHPCLVYIQSISLPSSRRRGYSTPAFALGTGRDATTENLSTRSATGDVLIAHIAVPLETQSSRRWRQHRHETGRSRLHRSDLEVQTRTSLREGVH